MFVLQLNPMTANAEALTPLMRAETEQELRDFLASESVEPYIDKGGSHPWRKTFRFGGPLEWYNCPNDNMEVWVGVQAIVDIGSREDWARRAELEYDETVARIPSI